MPEKPRERIFIGVDIGGTFTDVVAVNTAGKTWVVKCPSTPGNPAEAVLEGLDRLAENLGVPPDSPLENCRLFVHGSTVATNTLLEHKGAKVGLVTTKGFRDSLEIRRGIRADPWRHREPYPPVLVPRYRRLSIAGRIDADGTEFEALDSGALPALVEEFRREGTEAIAICLLNSVFNDSHERSVAKHLEAAGFGEVYASSVIAPILGEYERSSTTVLNAYVGDRTTAYIGALDEALRQRGLRRPLLLTQNNGGSITASQARERPASLLLSGPAAALGALKTHQAAIGSDRLVSMEIGGTSCDVLLMSGGATPMAEAIEIGDYLLAMPSLRIHTIGAGGGTIARVDTGGLLTVGPDGAGSEPGPAAYGRGGTEPTATDAHLVLGRLHPGRYAGGAVELSNTLAETAIKTHIAEKLGVETAVAAEGIIQLLEQKLAQAVQRMCLEQGEDIGRFVLVAAGGAGPMHGASIARQLGCAKVYVPRLAGAFCAFGMLQSDVRLDHLKVFLATLEPAVYARMQAGFAALKEQASNRLAEAGFSSEQTRFQYGVDLKYEGQQWDVQVDLGESAELDGLRNKFEERHQQLFGHIQPEGRITTTKLRLAAFGEVDRAPQAGAALAKRIPLPVSSRKVWIDGEAGWREAAVYEGPELRPGDELTGPAIVNEQTTTIVVGCDDRLKVDAMNNYMIEIAPPATEKH